MRTLHIVGVDLQLRFAVDSSVPREEQVAVRLLRVRLLRVLVNDDSPAENAVRPIAQYPVVELAAIAVRARMLDPHEIVHMLTAARHEEAVDQAVTALSTHDRMDVVPHQAASQQDRVGCDVAGPALLNAQGPDVERLLVLPLDHVVAHHGVVARHELCDHIREVHAAPQ